jgi:hypothetical protein
MTILAYNAACSGGNHPGSALRPTWLHFGRCHQEATMLSTAYTKLVKLSFHNEKTCELDGLYFQRLTRFSEHLSPWLRQLLKANVSNHFRHAATPA